MTPPATVVDKFSASLPNGEYQLYVRGIRQQEGVSDRDTGDRQRGISGHANGPAGVVIVGGLATLIATAAELLLLSGSTAERFRVSEPLKPLVGV